MQDFLVKLVSVVIEETQDVLAPQVLMVPKDYKETQEWWEIWEYLEWLECKAPLDLLEMMELLDPQDHKEI